MLDDDLGEAVARLNAEYSEMTDLDVLEIRLRQTAHLVAGDEVRLKGIVYRALLDAFYLGRRAEYWRRMGPIKV
jgi:hypothetical protein